MVPARHNFLYSSLKASLRAAVLGRQTATASVAPPLTIPVGSSSAGRQERHAHPPRQTTATSKRMTVVHARPGTDGAEVLRYWKEVHGP
jgi:hypothetical protein